MAIHFIFYFILMCALLQGVFASDNTTADPMAEFVHVEAIGLAPLKTLTALEIHPRPVPTETHSCLGVATRMGVTGSFASSHPNPKTDYFYPFRHPRLTPQINEIFRHACRAFEDGSADLRLVERLHAEFTRDFLGKIPSYFTPSDLKTKQGPSVDYESIETQSKQELMFRTQTLQDMMRILNLSVGILEHIPILFGDADKLR